MCSLLAFVKTILRLLTTHRSHAAKPPAQPTLHQSGRVSVCLLNLISKSLLSARPHVAPDRSCSHNGPVSQTSSSNSDDNSDTVRCWNRLLSHHV